LSFLSNLFLKKIKFKNYFFKKKLGGISVSAGSSTYFPFGRGERSPKWGPPAEA
jgi:hypothetical protein